MAEEKEHDGLISSNSLIAVETVNGGSKRLLGYLSSNTILRNDPRPQFEPLILVINDTSET